MPLKSSKTNAERDVPSHIQTYDTALNLNKENTCTQTSLGLRIVSVGRQPLILDQIKPHINVINIWLI